MNLTLPQKMPPKPEPCHCLELLSRLTYASWATEDDGAPARSVNDSMVMNRLRIARLPSPAGSSVFSQRQVVVVVPPLSAPADLVAALGTSETARADTNTQASGIGMGVGDG